MRTVATSLWRASPGAQRRLTEWSTLARWRRVLRNGVTRRRQEDRDGAPVGFTRCAVCPSTQQMVAMMLPKPSWPGAGPYPAETETTTRCSMLPYSVEPDLLMELATTTTMLTGMVVGGFELLPGAELHAAPQA